MPTRPCLRVGVINVSIENVVVKNKSYLPLPKGNYLKIMIKDHGTGIPEKLTTENILNTTYDQEKRLVVWV